MGIRCGVDIVEIDRIKKAVERERFINRVYTKEEAEYCESRRTGRYESYAARFAAKEAALKAFGTGMGRNGLNAGDIEVVNNPLGMPEIRLNGKAAEEYARIGAKGISLSMSHCGEYAVATVLLEVEDKI